MMLILEIATGVVLGGLGLMFLPYLLVSVVALAGASRGIHRTPLAEKCWRLTRIILGTGAVIVLIVTIISLATPTPRQYDYSYNYTPPTSEAERRQIASMFVPSVSKNIGLYTVRGPSAVQPSDPPAKPSFDCSRVTKWAALQVCATPSLAIADSRMSSLYMQLMAGLNGTEKSNLRDAQRAWVKKRDACEFSTAPGECLSDIYSSRISELTELVIMPEPGPVSVTPVTGLETAPAPGSPATDAQTPPTAQPEPDAASARTEDSLRPCTEEDKRIASMAAKNPIVTEG
jgi:uncharacterized protein